MSEARSAYGLVSQEPVLFDYSIEENIAYGDYASSPSHYDVVDAAKQANIHDFVISLPLVRLYFLIQLESAVSHPFKHHLSIYHNVIAPFLSNVYITSIP